MEASTTDTDLEWLQCWYSGQCNGDWEHQYGVEISNIDNPGWAVKIDLTDTALEGRHFERVEIENSDDDWLRCWVDDNRFEGAGGARNLGAIVRVFRSWVEGPRGWRGANQRPLKLASRSGAASPGGRTGRRRG
jgi:hypothetical protein